MRKAFIVLIVLFGVFLAIGCAGNKPVTSNETGTPAQAVTEAVKETPTGEQATATQMQNATGTPETREFTLEELAQYDGKNGKVYVAYQGQVYDASNSSYLWVNGSHKGCIAGRDITEEMDMTPHGSEILKNYTVIGTLKK